MNQADAKAQLLVEGLKSYLDVKQAIKAFETLIGEIAKSVMAGHLEDLREVTGQPELDETKMFIIRDLDPAPSRVGAGAYCGAPDTWGIRWGVKWNGWGTPGQDGAMVCVSVGAGAVYKQDKLFRTLSKVDDNRRDLNQSIRDWYSEARRKTGLCGLSTSRVYQCRVVRFSKKSAGLPSRGSYSQTAARRHNIRPLWGFPR